MHNLKCPDLPLFGSPTQSHLLGTVMVGLEWDTCAGTEIECAQDVLKSSDAECNVIQQSVVLECPI